MSNVSSQVNVSSVNGQKFMKVTDSSEEKVSDTDRKHIHLLDSSRHFQSNGPTLQDGESKDAVHKGDCQLKSVACYLRQTFLALLLYVMLYCFNVIKLLLCYYTDDLLNF